MIEGERTPSGTTPQLSSRLRRWGLPVVLSIAVLAALATQADIARLSDSLSRIDPLHCLAAFGLLLLSLLSRGIRLRHVSSRYHGSARLRDCMRLTARHQAAFTILPSGSGDLVFPLFAKRLLSWPLTTASRILFAFRALDAAGLLVMSAAAGAIHFIAPRSAWFVVLFLAGMTAAGAVFVSRAPEIAVAVHDLGIRALRRLRESALHQGMRMAVHMRESIAAERWTPVLWTFLVWGFAAAAFWSLFRMIGASVGVAEAVLILAGVNAAGAVSLFSIGGLGISEAGLSGVLVLLGFPTVEAVSLALIVRPAALLMTLASCALFEVVCRCYARVKAVVIQPSSSR